MNENAPTLPGFENIVKPFKFQPEPHEYKVIAWGCPTPAARIVATRRTKSPNTGQALPTHPYFKIDVSYYS